MKLSHFTDDVISDLRLGNRPMTTEEREALCVDTVKFEECSNTEAELRAMSDSDLMTAAYYVWVDYCRSIT